MPREITSHKVNGLNESLKILAMDEPGSSGVNHVYHVFADESVTTLGDGVTVSTMIQFQNGPIGSTNEEYGVVGVNGISGEALLAIVEDRLKSFQFGPYLCRENALALTHLQEAIHWLHHRTRERMQRGVEGTHQK